LREYCVIIILLCEYCASSVLLFCDKWVINVLLCYCAIIMWLVCNLYAIIVRLVCVMMWWAHDSCVIIVWLCCY